MCKTASDIVADAIPGQWLSAFDKEKLDTYPEDRDFVFSCGCWSNWEDHRCGPAMDFKSRYGCGCGVPDDCYCHEDCNSDDIENSCAAHSEEYRAAIVEDHAEAILIDINRNMWI